MAIGEWIQVHRIPSMEAKLSIEESFDGILLVGYDIIILPAVEVPFFMEMLPDEDVVSLYVQVEY